MQLQLDPRATGVLVIDFQEQLCAAMDEGLCDFHTKNVTHLLTLARRLELPVVATEQYPKGLGPTIGPIADLLLLTPHPKTAFSVMGDAAAAASLRATGRRAWIVVGMETHVCVFQTVRDMLAAGFDVQVPCDAVLSRTRQNLRQGLHLMQTAGAVITSTEAALFDLLKEGSGDAFKEVSRLIR